MTMHRPALTGVLAAGTALALGAAGVPAAQAHGTDLDARLTGPSATGRAWYDVDHRDRHGQHRELGVSVWNARRLAGRSLVVYVHGSRVGSMTVTRYGTAHLDRHGDMPAMHAGWPVRVRTQSGPLVAAGSFALANHHHDGPYHR